MDYLHYFNRLKLVLDKFYEISRLAHTNGEKLERSFPYIPMLCIIFLKSLEGA